LSRAHVTWHPVKTVRFTLVPWMVLGLAYSALMAWLSWRWPYGESRGEPELPYPCEIVLDDYEGDGELAVFDAKDVDLVDRLEPPPGGRTASPLAPGC
jgi:hypothetical protein